MHILALIVWIAFVLLMTTSGNVTMTWNGRKIPDTTINRLISSTLFFPAVGLVFWILGIVGKFMLSPIITLL